MGVKNSLGVDALRENTARRTKSTTQLTTAGVASKSKAGRHDCGYDDDISLGDITDIALGEKPGLLKACEFIWTLLYAEVFLRTFPP